MCILRSLWLYTVGHQGLLRLLCSWFINDSWLFCIKLQAEPWVTPFNLKALFTSLIDLYSILQLNLKDHHTHHSVNYREVYYLGALHIGCRKTSCDGLVDNNKNRPKVFYPELNLTQTSFMRTMKRVKQLRTIKSLQNVPPHFNFFTCDIFTHVRSDWNVPYMQCDQISLN